MSVRTNISTVVGGNVVDHAGFARGLHGGKSRSGLVAGRRRIRALTLGHQNVICHGVGSSCKSGETIQTQAKVCDEDRSINAGVISNPEDLGASYE